MITQEIIATALKIVLWIINTFCVCFICISISKWLRRLEDKIDELKTMLYVDLNRYTVLYLELLKRLKDEFVKREDFESAMQMQRLINNELERIRHEKDNVQR